jgi:hypothetical protein
MSRTECSNGGPHGLFITYFHLAAICQGSGSHLFALSCAIQFDSIIYVSPFSYPSPVWGNVDKQSGCLGRKLQRLDITHKISELEAKLNITQSYLQICPMLWSLCQIIHSFSKHFSSIYYAPDTGTRVVNKTVKELPLKCHVVILPSSAQANEMTGTLEAEGHFWDKSAPYQVLSSIEPNYHSQPLTHSPHWICWHLDFGHHSFQNSEK